METFMDSFLCDLRCKDQENSNKKEICEKRFCKEKKTEVDADYEGIVERKSSLL